MNRIKYTAQLQSLNLNRCLSANMPHTNISIQAVGSIGLVQQFLMTCGHAGQCVYEGILTTCCHWNNVTLMVLLTLLVMTNKACASHYARYSLCVYTLSMYLHVCRGKKHYPELPELITAKNIWCAGNLTVAR